MSTVRRNLFRNFRPEEFPVVPISGQGSKIYDIEGREYTDYLLGSGPLILGHGHPRVKEAIRQQLDRGVQFFMTTPETAKLADELIKAVPCAETTRFASSGTEATYFALRLARAYTKRQKILKFEGGYHGWHDYGLMSSTPKAQLEFPLAESDSPGIPEAMRDLVLVAPFNDIEASRSIVNRHADEIAAVIVEPYQRYIAPVPGFLKGLRDLTRELEIVLIFDEVATGFRLAYGGAQEYYGVVPDLAALGKAIGGGLPLSAICGRADIMELCSPMHMGDADWVPQLGTFNGNPLSAAAGFATLQELKHPDAYPRLHSLGRRMRKGLREALRILDVPVEIFGEGPTFKVLFTEGRVVDYRSTLKADNELLRRFELEWIRQGIYIAPGWRHYISLAHSTGDIDTALERAEAAAQGLLRRSTESSVS